MGFKPLFLEVGVFRFLKICKRMKLPDRLAVVTFPNKVKAKWGLLVEINDT